jgi:transcriptional regulator GlxA family with amidase domain
MKNVVIIVPESSVLQAIADPQYCFEATNQFLVNMGKKPLFRIVLAGKKRSIKLNNGRYVVQTDALLPEIKKADIIFIPALAGDLETALSLNNGILPWIREQHVRGAEIASLCLGAFLLAETGLLNGGKCSTHWGFAREFRVRYPDVELVDGGIITESNGIYSSGGANSYWNLLLHLVEKHTSREMSILVAKYFAVDIDRESQSSFSIFQGQKTHPDRIILKAQELIEKSINKKISVEDLAEQLALGRRSLERRFKSATGNSVLEYIQRVKMEVAKRNFETTMKTIQEVMYAIGYNDIKAFRTTFKKITGITPVAYRNKYLKRTN